MDIWKIKIAVGSINYSINVTGKTGYSNEILIDPVRSSRDLRGRSSGKGKTRSGSSIE